MGRRVAREVVFKYLFEKDMNKELGFNRDFYSKREDILELEEAQVGYVLDTVENVLINIEKIDKYIEDSIEVWNFERVGSVERALLRYAVYEIKFSDIGVEIIINEAVELAKRYGEEKSSEFINGVLAKIAKK
ncbi:MAG: transcription antitermination factor NusB [Fusobacteriaceae bacterium]|nr:transcription antitermination factor NusB [Fusobacteriaceae bacterium]MBN2837532.1 transcription antitermination factor NusB [Fusobacteriaceae bacterium]